MTVKCITPDEKAQIIQMFGTKNYQQKELASIFFTSERTINRVLVEARLLTAVPRIKAEAYTTMQILKKHDVAVEDLDAILAALYNQKKVTALDVQTFLLTLTDTETSELFYNAAMTKFEMQLETVMAESSMATQYLEAMDEDLPF